MLYVVSTPIGNLGDLSARAIETLKAADVVAAEDTRVTRKLMSHFAIRTPLVSYHEHSGPDAAQALIRRMLAGQSVALVTDAGTPGVSDPGIDLVSLSIDAGVAVVPIPGPSAAIAALTGSGLPSARFAFEGFLPRTKSSRMKKLAALAGEARTVIVYESPKRIAATLTEAAAVFGAARSACVARELTKKFEEFRRGSLGALAEHYASSGVRGECVLVIAGALGAEWRRVEDRDVTVAASGDCAAEGDPHGRDLIRLLAQEVGIPRRDLYRMVLDLKKKA